MPCAKGAQPQAKTAGSRGASRFGGLLGLRGATILEPPRISEGIGDPEGILGQLLRGPCAGPPLSERVRGCRRVLVLCDDATRATPTVRLLPPLLEALKDGGVSDEGVRVLFATGSHRPVTEREAEEKLGPSLVRRLRWDSHRMTDPLLRLGVTSGGTSVEVNPLLGEADLVVALGSVVPHRFCGWSGGGKMVLPGVSGEASILRTHWMQAEDRRICLGSSENRALEEIREAALLAGLAFLVQAVGDGEGRLASLHAGPLVPVHREAIDAARRTLGVSCVPAEVVVAEAWPEDRDLWQAGKALYAAELAVRPGGLVILVADLPEGLGEHRAYGTGFARPCASIRATLEAPPVSDPLGLAGAFATARVRERAQVWLVRAAGPLEGVDLRSFRTLEEALSAARRLYPDGRVLALAQAPLVLPLPKEETS